MAKGKTKKKPRGAWQSRIVDHGVEAAGQLLAHSQNWRVHGKQQQAAMQALLGGALGWVQGVIVNKRTAVAWGRDRNVQVIIDGHLRAQLALKQGDETPVPVTYVDLDPRDERLALASFDRIGALAGTDDEQYDALLADLADVGEDIAAVLVRPRKKKGLTHEVKQCTCCTTRCAPGCGCYRAD